MMLGFKSQPSAALLPPVQHRITILSLPNKLEEARVSLSEIKSEHSDYVIRREFDLRGCFQWLEWPAAPAHLCSRISVSALCCNSPCTKRAIGAGAARRR